KMTAFEQWCQSVAKMPPQNQVEAVAVKLKELNPEFGGKVGKIEDGVLDYGVEFEKVAFLRVPTDHISDISPVRALPGLRDLYCRPANEWEGVGKLTDLWPLTGLPLERLGCSANPGLTDLTPLAGMKLRALWIHRTGVTDLSVVKDFPLERLICSFTP